MPGLSKTALADRLAKGLFQGGARMGRAEFSGPRGHLPWLITVESAERSPRDYRVYMWTIGHGGRTRSQDEYRIQTMLPDKRTLEFGRGTTVLLGYYDERVDRSGRAAGNQPPAGMEVVVAWDAVQHLRVGASSSCQVPFTLMENAYFNGVAARARRLAEDEVEQVIAMQLDYLAGYLLEAAGGHGFVVPENVMNRRLRMVGS